MRTDLEIVISSPPDRKNLVAEIWNNSEHLAEINRESDQYVIEIYPTRSGEAWRLNVDNLIQIMIETKARLDQRFESNPGTGDLINGA